MARACGGGWDNAACLYLCCAGGQGVSVQPGHNA